MKKVLLVANLLWAGVFAADKPAPRAAPAHPSPTPDWSDFLRVLSSKEIIVSVGSIPSDSTLIVSAYGYKCSLLLTAYEPMLVKIKGQATSKHFSYAEVLTLEISLVMDDRTGQRRLAFSLLPAVGYSWRIQIKNDKKRGSATGGNWNLKPAMNGINTIYLGDAVYAHYDGYGIELRLNSHEPMCCVS